MNNDHMCDEINFEMKICVRFIKSLEILSLHNQNKVLKPEEYLLISNQNYQGWTKIGILEPGRENLKFSTPFWKAIRHWIKKKFRR